MALRITNTEITSDVVGEAAFQRDERWYVTGYPGRAFDRNQAITAMTLAEERASANPDLNLITDLESEL